MSETLKAGVDASSTGGVELTTATPDRPVFIDKVAMLGDEPNFSDHIRSLARSDAVHDIHETTKWFTDSSHFGRLFNDSILQQTNIVSHPNEDQSFMSVINNAAARQDFLDTFKIDAIDNPGPFQVGYRSGANFTPLHEYSCTAISVKKTTGNMVEPNPNFAANFIEKTGLTQFALIVDFNTHEFLESFKNGTQVVGEIFFALTPEVINDPAPKTSMQNTMFNVDNTTTGFKMTPIYQTDNEPTFYSKYDRTNNAYNNNFMSAYDFKLSKLTRVITKKVESFTTDLTITTLNNGQPYSSYIVNGKHENSNKTVTSFLRSLVATINKHTSAAGGISFQNKFDITTKYQQKRLGDWGQCLACLDLNNRNFNIYTPPAISAAAAAAAVAVEQSIVKSDFNRLPKFIVTHDKICVTYALLMGANVMYLDYYGIAYIFKNQADTTLASIPYPQLLYNTLIKEFYTTGNDSLSTNINKILAFNFEYNKGRKNEFKKKHKQIREQLPIIREYITQHSNNITVDTVKELITRLNTLFCLCVELKYMEMYLIDTLTDINQFETSPGKLRADVISYGLDYHDSKTKPKLIYNPTHNDKYVELYSSFNILNGVFTQHGNSYDPDIDTPNNIITDGWLNIVKKLDVHKSAAKLFEEESTSQKTTKYDIRLLNYNNGEEKRVNDSFMFLPYIQHINAVTRNAIIQLFDIDIVPNIVIPLYSRLLTKSSFVAGAMRVFRNGAQAQDQKQFNQLVDLVYQVRVFLTPTPEELVQDGEILDKLLDSVKGEAVAVAEVASVASVEVGENIHSKYKAKFKECIQKVIDDNNRKKLAKSAKSAGIKATADLDEFNADTDITDITDTDEQWDAIGGLALDCYGINKCYNAPGKVDEVDIHIRSATIDDAIVTADFGGIMLSNTSMLSNKTKYDIGTALKPTAADENDVVYQDDIDGRSDGSPSEYHKIMFGGHRYYAQDPTNVAGERKREKNVANSICDMSIKQTTYPLFINSLFKKYIPLEEIGAVSREPTSNEVIGRLNKYESEVAKHDSPIVEPTSILENELAKSRKMGKSVEKQSPIHTRPTADEHEEMAAVATTGRNPTSEIRREPTGNANSNALNQIYGYTPHNVIPGGAPSPQFSILENHEFGFHPLLPLYMVLQPFYFVITESLTKSCFYNENLKYIKIIEKMCTELIKVINTSQKDALMIGFGLRTFIFTATRINNNEPLTLARYRKMLEIIDMTESEYRTICNKWDIFVNTYGIIRETPAEIIERNQYLESPLFRDFITNKVNIKQIIGTEIAEFPTETELNTNVIQLLKIIADKIWSDRNPHWTEPVQPAENRNQVEILQPTQLTNQPVYGKKVKNTKKVKKVKSRGPYNKTQLKKYKTTLKQNKVPLIMGGSFSLRKNSRTRRKRVN